MPSPPWRIILQQQPGCQSKQVYGLGQCRRAAAQRIPHLPLTEAIPAFLIEDFEIIEGPADPTHAFPFSDASVNKCRPARSGGSVKRAKAWPNIEELALRK